MGQLTEFGAKLDKALKAKKMTDADLAKKLKISPPAVFALKNKTKNPRPETIKQLAKILNKRASFFALEPKAELTMEFKKDAKPATTKAVKSKAEVKTKSSVPQKAMSTKSVKEMPKATTPAPKEMEVIDNVSVYLVVEQNGQVISKKQLRLTELLSH